MTNLKKDVIDKRLVNSVKYLYFSMFENNCKNKHKYKRAVEGSNVYDWPCFLFANALTVLTVDFEMAFWSARSG